MNKEEAIKILEKIGFSKKIPNIYFISDGLANPDLLFENNSKEQKGIFFLDKYIICITHISCDYKINQEFVKLNQESDTVIEYKLKSVDKFKSSLIVGIDGINIQRESEDLRFYNIYIMEYIKKDTGYLKIIDYIKYENIIKPCFSPLSIVIDPENCKKWGIDGLIGNSFSYRDRKEAIDLGELSYLANKIIAKDIKERIKKEKRKVILITKGL